MKPYFGGALIGGLIVWPLLGWQYALFGAVGSLVVHAIISKFVK
jgi:hypothetical protein